MTPPPWNFSAGSKAMAADVSPGNAHRINKYRTTFKFLFVINRLNK